MADHLLSVAPLVVEALAALVVGSWASASLRRSPAERVMAWGVASMAVLVGVPLGLGVLGLLSAPGVLVAHLGLAAVALRRWPGASSRVSLPARPSGVAVLAGAAGAWFGAITLVLLQRPGSLDDVDTAQYHVPNLAHWLQRGSIWGLPWQNPAFATATHPGNGELLGLWLALPTRSDELIAVAPVLFAGLLIVAMIGLGAELGARPGWSALAAVALLASPLVFSTQVRSLSTDLPGAAGVVAGLAFALALRTSDDGRRWTWVGVALGLAVGAKYSAAGPALLVLAVGWVVAPAHRRSVVRALPGLVTFAGPWFVRNLVETGNPLFPLAVGPLPGAETPLNELSTPVLAHVLAARGGVLADWADLAWRLLGGVLPLVVGGVVLALHRAWRARRANRETPTELLATAVVAVGTLAAYSLTPYTGGGPEGLTFLLGSNLRYVLPGAAIGLVLALAVVPRFATGLVLGGSLLHSVYRIRAGAGFRADLDVGAATLAGATVAAVIVGVAMAWGVPRLRHHESWRPWMAGAAVLACLGAGVLALDRRDPLAGPGPVETAVQQVKGERDTNHVVVLFVTDARAALGPDLDGRLVGVGRGGAAGETPIADPEALDAAIRNTEADVLVTGNVDLVGRPEGWEPDAGWCAIATDGRHTAYRRGACAEGGS